MAEPRQFMFVGVTTRSSAVVGVFSDWCDTLRVDWELAHCDIDVGASSEAYVELVERLRSDQIAGAVVTTHKAAVFRTQCASFDLIEPAAAFLAEIGVVFKRAGCLCGGVPDIDSGGLTLRRILRSGSWARGDRRAVILGGGGAGLAAAWNLAVVRLGDVSDVVVCETDDERATEIREIVRPWPAKVPIRVDRPSHGVADESVLAAGAAPLIVNATGMGKDRPGSPLSDSFEFPVGSSVWDFNYRGSLEFLHLAKGQALSRGLTVRDGFEYFSAGWSVVMSKVAGLPWSEQVADRFARRAARHSAGSKPTCP